MIFLGEKGNYGFTSLFRIYSDNSGTSPRVISLEVVTKSIAEEYAHLLFLISGKYYFYRFNSANALSLDILSAEYPMRVNLENGQ